ncbi:hypothetical protein DFAR_1780004 [Desulfarculales bacterium]
MIIAAVEEQTQVVSPEHVRIAATKLIKSNEKEGSDQSRIIREFSSN